ncbi:hypothetical protein [Pseudomonas matsuisoli]|nr:hypothetical protein [Pseudomonas matsuisoli]
MKLTEWSRYSLLVLAYEPAMLIPSQLIPVAVIDQRQSRHAEILAL